MLVYDGNQTMIFARIIMIFVALRTIKTKYVEPLNWSCTSVETFLKLIGQELGIKEQLKMPLIFDLFSLNFNVCIVSIWH